MSDYLGATSTFPDAISHEDHDLIEDAVDELLADRIGTLRWGSDGAREDVSSHRLSAIDDQGRHPIRSDDEGLNKLVIPPGGAGTDKADRQRAI